MVFTDHDEFVIHNRGFKSFDSDDQMVEWLESHGAFHSAGWSRNFLDFYISDYSLDRIYDFLTRAEVQHLREVQQRKRNEAKERDRARDWKLKETLHWADNSTEEVWEDKDGIRKTVTVVQPHGDAC